MGSVEVAGEVAKKCYKNNTAGWLGVVKLNHLGAPEGESIEPFGTVYLSDDEAKLTARAPKDPANNPFVEQMFSGVDAAGVIHPMPITPLTLISDERFLPGQTERFVPGQDIPEQVAATKRDGEALLTDPSLANRDTTLPIAPQMTPSAAASPPAPTAPTPGLQTPAATPAGPVAVPPTQQMTDEQPPSWVDVPGRTETPQKGHLGGGATPAGPTDVDTAKVGGPLAAPPQASVHVGVGGMEEHAAETATGEETGAAETPVGKATEGEYAQHEEVGSPDAPRQDSSSEAGSDA